MAVQAFRFSTTQPYAAPPDSAEPSYPERYILLVVVLVIVVKILCILQRHRMEHEFDGYTSRTGMEPNNPSITTSSLPAYSPLPASASSIVMRPSDDPYAAGVSSLSAGSSEVLPPPAYREVARKYTDHNAPPPPYAQAKSLPPPPQPLNLPDSVFERHFQERYHAYRT